MSRSEDVPPPEDTPRPRGPAVLFLDIDGVLAPFDGPDVLDVACVGRLDTLVAATGAEVVVCSSWRETMTLEQIGEALAARGFSGRITGATPIDPTATRDDEVRAYLATKRNVVTFVILDDQAGYGRELSRHHVLVDDTVGLSAADVLLARRILGRGRALKRGLP